jgi:myo-inositol 2-dehydrogenase/D-chiro-inositol 1-dehydrogenase
MGHATDRRELTGCDTIFMRGSSENRHETGRTPSMDFLILGDGLREREWARAIAEHERHHLIACCPGLDEYTDVPSMPDLDAALALADVQAVVVGGAPEFRAEALRRVAAAGLPAICLHPPGPDSEAYYQVSMSRAETGAVLVPDLPARLHPAVVKVRRALDDDELGSYRGISYEVSGAISEGDLARVEFARAVDVVRALLGEIEAVSAIGDPPGVAPDESLVVQLRGEGQRRAEVRLRAGRDGPSRLILTGEKGTLEIELPVDGDLPARLTRRARDGSETSITVEDWNPHHALLDVLERATRGEDAHPDLGDGTRAMEVAVGAIRSLRRGRTVDLHYEEISEAGTFKSVMTSVGCLVLFAVLFVLPVALAGPALGFGWTIYIAYLIPPLLIGFVFLQLLRFGIRDRKAGRPDTRPTDWS